MIGLNDKALFLKDFIFTIADHNIDEHMKCFWECPLFLVCQSRIGADCKKFGGTEIPKIRK